MLISGTSTDPLQVIAAVGAISGPVFSSVWGWIIVAVGIPLGFVVARYVISLFKHGVGKSR